MVGLPSAIAAVTWAGQRPSGRHQDKGEVLTYDEEQAEQFSNNWQQMLDDLKAQVEG